MITQKNKFHLNQMGFEKRKLDATEFEKEVLRYMESMGIHVAKNGTEHTHPNFVAMLRQSADTTSLSIRFQPDAVCCIANQCCKFPKSFYLEIKSGYSIEKYAYQNYMKLHDSGNIVLIVFQDKKWAFIENLQLIHGGNTVKNFHRPFPVDSNGWICPRNSENWEYGAFPTASGTPYKCVDDRVLRNFSELKAAIEYRLFYDF